MSGQKQTCSFLFGNQRKRTQKTAAAAVCCLLMQRIPAQNLHPAAVLSSGRERNPDDAAEFSQTARLFPIHISRIENFQKTVEMKMSRVYNRDYQIGDRKQYLNAKAKRTAGWCKAVCGRQGTCPGEELRRKPSGSRASRYREGLLSCTGESRWYRDQVVLMQDGFFS